MPPELNAANLPAPTSTSIPLPITPYSFTDALFTDAEGDPVLITMTSTPPTHNSWINFDYTGGVVTVSGTLPADNNYAMTYTLTFDVFD